MRVGVMVTDHGSHPPSKWAAETAAQIVDAIVIDPASFVFDALNSAKNKFQAELEQILAGHHGTVQTHEVSALDVHGAKRYDHPIEPEAEHLDDAVSAVQAVADKSMFATHFRKPEVQKFVRSTVSSHFATVRDIERKWHSDKNSA